VPFAYVVVSSHLGEQQSFCHVKKFGILIRSWVWIVVGWIFAVLFQYVFFFFLVH